MLQNPTKLSSFSAITYEQPSFCDHLSSIFSKQLLLFLLLHQESLPEFGVIDFNVKVESEPRNEFAVLFLATKSQTYSYCVSNSFFSYQLIRMEPAAGWFTYETPTRPETISY
jgi:hypothetical protein